MATLREKERTRYRKGNIGFVFQSFNLIDELNVFENVELPLIYLRVKASERQAPRQRDAEAAHEHLAPRRALPAAALRRSAAARGHCPRPGLEPQADSGPTSPPVNLDSKNGREVMELLSELNREGTTVIMVTHSQYDSTFAHRVLHLFDGELVKDLTNRM